MRRALVSVAKPIVGSAERRAVVRVMKSGMLAQGPEVQAFEEEFSDRVAAGRPVVAVNSGTSGLHLSLLAAGIGPGDEVIVPSFTFAATANSVALTGATPVFADISLDTYCLDPASVDSVVTRRTAAIMPVHLYGHPAPMADLRDIAEKRHLAVFEDAAQAHLAELDGVQVGAFGTFATFSLYPTKNMTSGEGGMVVCENEDLARKVRLLRNQGMASQYENEVIGLNNRMTDIHAAIGRVQLGKLSRWTEKRRENADFLTRHITGAVTPVISDGATHVFHQYTVRVEGDRDRFVSRLRDDFGIGTGVYYPIPNHHLPSLKKFAGAAELPNTLHAAQQVVSLPVHPSLRRKDLERIVEAVNTVGGAQ